MPELADLTGITADDIKVVADQKIEPLIIVQRIRQSSIAFLVSVIFILGWGLIAMVVLFDSFLIGKEPPNWAVSLESATVTATLAMLFKEHLPSINDQGGRP